MNYNVSKLDNLEKECIICVNLNELRRSNENSH